MKKHLHDIKSIIKYTIYVISVMTACYGFWGCLFPELTLVKGTYRVVGTEEYTEDAEQLYVDILDNKVTVTYRSKLWDFLRNWHGFGND